MHFIRDLSRKIARSSTRRTPSRIELTPGVWKGSCLIKQCSNLFWIQMKYRNKSCSQHRLFVTSRHYSLYVTNIRTRRLYLLLQRRDWTLNAFLNISFINNHLDIYFYLLILCYIKGLTKQNNDKYSFMLSSFCTLCLFSFITFTKITRFFNQWFTFYHR